jgi:hypothetical protein
MQNVVDNLGDYIMPKMDQVLGLFAQVDEWAQWLKLGPRKEKELKDLKGTNSDVITYLLSKTQEKAITDRMFDYLYWLHENRTK